MRGRPPQQLALNADDIETLQRIARSQTRPWYQVRRARTVLGIAAGERVQTLAEYMDCTPQTIRRTCLRYERQGLDGLLAGPQRTGHPFEISPPAARSDRATGLPGTDR